MTEFTGDFFTKFETVFLFLSRDVVFPVDIAIRALSVTAIAEQMLQSRSLVLSFGIGAMLMMEVRPCSTAPFQTKEARIFKWISLVFQNFKQL